ncbi:MAG: CHASE2 domain-containing protein [Candidatus Rokuibacteriota bacterium]
MAIATGYAPLFETWEARTLDIRMRAFADPARADPSIVIVVIDQTSLDTVAARIKRGWPWPRDFYAAILTYLLGAGARAVAFDLIFSEPSIYTQELGVADDDAALAGASEGKPVVHALNLTRERERTVQPDRAWAPGFGPGRLATPIEAPFDYRLADAFDKATLPIEPILRAARALGWIGFEPDDDGTCRAIRPSAAYRPVGVEPAVEVRAVSLTLAALGGARIEVRSGRVPRLTVDGRQIPLDGEGRMLLRFHGGEGAYREFPFANVLYAAAGGTSDAVRAEDFRDKFVIVAAKATGLLDLRVTPMRSVTPGYTIHATALDNFLHGDALRRVPLTGRVAAALVLGVLCGAVVVGLAVRAGALTAAGLILVQVAAAVAAFEARNVWVDVVVPTLAIGLAYAGATGYAYLTEGRERRFLKGAFARYLAPEVVDALVASPERLALGGETRELTVMFVDVAGFTGLSEGRKPEEVVAVMNEYFNELTGVIQREGGTVDKFIGDAVMAFWNAPVRQADHAARASRAARGIHEGIERVNQRLKARDLPSLSARVGLATGEALVGNVGSSTKFNYTAMGDTVNLASRLEGAAKQFHTTTLVAGTTAAAADGAVEFRELDLIQVKGRAEPVPIYTIEGSATPDGPRAEARAVFARALHAYRARDFAGAARDFDAAAALDPDDGPARTLAERAHEFMITPPPAGWRGEFQLTSK